MTPLFPRWSNAAFRTVVALVAGGGALAVGGLLIFPQTPFATGQQDQVVQPVQFDHRHHVSDEGIDCRFCHSTVDRGPSAGIPAAGLCMGCHGQVWRRSPMLNLVRESYYSGQPIPWRRVHRVPDFVFFNHAIHVNKGVGCESCHGRVDQMAAVHQSAPLTMAWCLDCHRHPERNLRPLENITDMGWRPPRPQEEFGRELMARYGVVSRENCTTCHR